MTVVTLPEIKIGTQVWAGRNLDVPTFRNGDSIPQAQTPEEWARAGAERKPAWCYYQNDPANGKIYGRLYNWYAVSDRRGLAPPGWHIPSNEEWIILENHVGVKEAGTNVKSVRGWHSNGSGRNSTGFDLLPGGYRGKEGGFSGIGEFTYLSGSTEDGVKDSIEDKSFFWGRGVNYENRDMMRCGLNKEHGVYVRCIKDTQ